MRFIKELEGGGGGKVEGGGSNTTTKAKMENLRAKAPPNATTKTPPKAATKTPLKASTKIPPKREKIAREVKPPQQFKATFSSVYSTKYPYVPENLPNPPTQKKRGRPRTSYSDSDSSGILVTQTKRARTTTTTTTTNGSNSGGGRKQNSEIDDLDEMEEEDEVEEEEEEEEDDDGDDDDDDEVILMAKLVPEVEPIVAGNKFMNKWTAKEQIGQGGAGVVWSGIDYKNGASVAIKKMFNSKYASQLFVKEVTVLKANSSNPHTPKLLSSDPKSNVLIMELVGSLDVKDAIRLTTKENDLNVTAKLTGRSALMVCRSMVDAIKR